MAEHVRGILPTHRAEATRESRSRHAGQFNSFDHFYLECIEYMSHFIHPSTQFDCSKHFFSSVMGFTNDVYKG